MKMTKTKMHQRWGENGKPEFHLHVHDLHVHATDKFQKNESTKSAQPFPFDLLEDSVVWMFTTLGKGVTWLAKASGRLIVRWFRNRFMR